MGNFKSLAICFVVVFLLCEHGAQSSQLCIRRGRVSYPKWPRYWQNSWEGPLTVQCRNGAITGINSVYDSNKKDRRFTFACSDLKHNKGWRVTMQRCFWSDFSWLEKYVQYNCPQNYILSGWESSHDNVKGDRSMRFKCCKPYRGMLAYCRSTGYVNRFGQKFRYQAHFNYVITGVNSYYSSFEEDRRFAFTVCTPVYY